MSDWINILGLLGLGAVITELARGAINWFMHERLWSDEKVYPYNHPICRR